jgi:pimeloyl-ACP methyl ester carboxylesterase
MTQYITANGINFAYLTEGSGPLVLMLHGFPDNAHTWSHQMPALAAQGYRVVAPFLKGYAPTDAPAVSGYDKAALVDDISALVRQLSPDQPCHFVGQDWGAIIGYALLAAYPERFKSAVLMAVPHPAEVAKSLLIPKHLHRSFHWWFFQMKDLPEAALLHDDMAFIDYLWSYWTTEGFTDETHIRSVKSTLKQPGVLRASLAYYRAMFDTSKTDPTHDSVRALMSRPIRVPTLALCGADDLRAELMHDQGAYFEAPYTFKLIDRAGHFLHREQPQAVTQQILNWFSQ